MFSYGRHPTDTVNLGFYTHYALRRCRETLNLVPPTSRKAYKLMSTMAYDLQDHRVLPGPPPLQYGAGLSGLRRAAVRITLRCTVRLVICWGDRLRHISSSRSYLHGVPVILP